jgi:hypothetical protein
LLESGALKGQGPFPLLLTQPRFYQVFWAEDALKRGYISCLYPGLDVHHHEPAYPEYENVWRRFQAECPEATWASSLAIQGWLASRALDHVLDPKYGYDVAKDQVGIIGFSRYGKQSLYAAAFDERFTSVVARSSGSPTAAPYRFAGRQTFMESIEDFPAPWARASLRAFTSKHRQQNLDWFDLSFGRGTARQSDFPEVLLHHFDWNAWKATQTDQDLENPFKNTPAARDAADRRARIEWSLGKTPQHVGGEGQYHIRTADELGVPNSSVRNGVKPQNDATPRMRSSMPWPAK